MKLPFEIWIEKSNFSPTVKALFIESTICYKSNAYRASLLLSYLGFLTALKDRILSANKPNLFPKGEWDALTKRLQNEDTWESNVFDATQQMEKVDNNKVKIKDAIFSIPDSLRHQIKYWKDRRNDCAHNKDNQITSSHIEVFWVFLESNNLKISVEGGVQSFLYKLKLHYDKTYTPKGKDVTPLVQEIEYTVQSTELGAFWEQAFTIVDNMYEYWIDNNVLDFVDKVFTSTNDSIQKSLITFLKTKESTLFDIVSINPKWFLLLGFTAQEIRNFWNTKIFKTKNCLGLFACLLRNNLIPQNEIEEANTLIFNKLKYYTDSQEDHITLLNNGFGNTINRIAFEENNIAQFMWVNNKADILRDYIEQYPLTSIAVEKLCIEFNKDNFFSFWLLERLEKLFSDNQNKKAEFLTIANQYGFELPKQITSLNL